MAKIKIKPLWLTLSFFVFALVSLQALAVVVVPPPNLNPLNQTVVPIPPQIAIYTKNNTAAIRLGKAFFWDMQVGSDGIQSCATCHFHAGADSRLKNQLNPGTNAGDTIFGNNFIGVPGFPQFRPNYALDPINDFPFHRRQEPDDLETSPIIRHTNDIVGSQGIRLSEFVDVVSGSAVDSVVSSELDHVFSIDGVNLRRVTGRNTPTVINAIFNFTNFWDGRANFLFNGENPFGPADPNTGVWFNDPEDGLVKRRVTIQFASLASQATGPPMDTTEMSGRGRTFPHLGKKMLSLVPLGKQIVHPQDSVLGILSRAQLQPDGTYSGNGLNTTYSQMIQDAFEDYLWDSNQLVTITLPNGQQAQFTQMEANFSLFWGLAIQLYESTLVSDETPFDHWLAGDPNALNDQQQLGFLLFDGVANCSACHLGTEFTAHSQANIAFLDNFNNAAIELMFVSDGNQAIYDEGFNNTSVTPTEDDLGRGRTAPFINPLTGEHYPLSSSDLSELQRLDLLPFETFILPPFLPPDIRTNVNGTFKMPGLRNVELTGPYFHNGSVMTLDDVLDFYSRGGNFSQENIHELDPIIGAGLTLIRGNDTLHLAIVEFLKSLTDPRVKNEAAPFDHPELFIPEGDPEILRRIPARSFDGTAAPVSTLTVNAVISPTAFTSQTVSGTVQAGLTPQVTVNTSADAGPVLVDGINWSTQISNLADGDNIVTVSVIDPNNIQTILTATITIIDTSPVITSTAITAAKAGELYTYQVTAIDPTQDVTTFSLVTAPDGMIIYPQWGLIIWLPTSAQLGTHNVTVKVADTFDLFDTQSFTITVTPPENLTVSRAAVSAQGAAAAINGPRWTLQGTGLAGTTISIFLGADLTGELIGNTTVSRNGRWSFRRNAQVTPPLTEVTSISISSSAGAAVLDYPLTAIRRITVNTTGSLAAIQGPLWNLQGTGSPRTILSIYLGPDLTGELIGTATVAPNGNWRLVGRRPVTLPVTATSISISTSAGGTVLNRPLIIR